MHVYICIYICIYIYNISIYIIYIYIYIWTSPGMPSIFQMGWYQAKNGVPDVITCSEREDHRSTDGHKLPAFSQGLQKDILQDAPGQPAPMGVEPFLLCLEKDIMGVSINAGSPKCLVYKGKSNKTTPIDVFMLCYVCNSMQSVSLRLSTCLHGCMHARTYKIWNYVSMYLSVYVSIYLTIYLSIYLFIYLSIYLYLYFSLSIYLSFFLSFFLSHLSISSISIWKPTAAGPSWLTILSMPRHKTTAGRTW
jgi:hypothetical protein